MTMVMEERTRQSASDPPGNVGPVLFPGAHEDWETRSEDHWFSIERCGDLLNGFLGWRDGRYQWGCTGCGVNGMFSTDASLDGPMEPVFAVHIRPGEMEDARLKDTEARVLCPDCAKKRAGAWPWLK